VGINEIRLDTNDKIQELLWANTVYYVNESLAWFSL